MKYVAPSALFLLAVSHAFGQDSIKNHSFHFSAFADVYFHTTFPQQKPFDRPDFLYNHKQQYTPGINLAMAKASYKGKRLQVNVGLMAGDYARYNLASEPALLRHVYEANIGWKFSSAISLEAGILPSHIGLESAISKDALTLSRSFIAENSPYYETGAKLNVAFLPKWTASVLLLNGWQRISNNNRSLAYGTQLQFLPNENWLINSSTFIGNEQNSSQPKQLRWFHNLYANYTATSKWRFAYMFDIVTQQQQQWWGTALVAQHKPSTQWAIAGRAEYYSDPEGVIVSQYLPNQFKATGASLNVDFLPVQWGMLRSEWRYIQLANGTALYNGVSATSTFSCLLSASVWW